MVVMLDHLILTVNDREASVRFYTEDHGFRPRGAGRPLLGDPGQPRDDVAARPPGAPRAASHLAFALSPEEFDAAFARVRAAGAPLRGLVSTTSATCRDRARRPGRVAWVRRCTSSIPTAT